MASSDLIQAPAGSDRSPRRQDARRNHEKVMAAARELFAQHGLQVTVPQVAERAGVGRATVYRSYPTKDDLIVAVTREQFQELEERTLAALRSEDAYQALCAYIPDMLDHLLRNRGLAAAFFEGRLVPAGRLLGLIGRLVEAAKASGQVRQDADERDLRVVLCGVIRQLIVLDEWDPAVWRRYGDMVLGAFRP
ncbi:TetR/AcrR family transcriptional regulator [Nonomuraea aridisoli]|uniref:TetR family transcriptional regulator n=1 Tax=Nonomuraea aridisoli TaxID=2070368 RepID=A0A2W2DYI4_9ACTN|nr:TetR/AcrR family transcriptional regulator [Nonomuraea aridisoli]PZG04938.1 TetR family transcriptional regulator [Nonomuraea aridisoli]